MWRKSKQKERPASLEWETHGSVFALTLATASLAISLLTMFALTRHLAEEAVQATVLSTSSSATFEQPFGVHSEDRLQIFVYLPSPVLNPAILPPPKLGDL